MTKPRRRGKPLAIIILTATLLTSAHFISQGGHKSRRLLAYSAQTDHGLYTVEVVEKTALQDITALQAGAVIKLAGIQRGHTIRASRIEVVEN
jgi:hypothetical protein